jgi:putative peptidoglycan lipid II flippase
VITVAAKIGLNMVLIIPLGFLGLALATSLASWLNCGMLMSQLQHKTGTHWHLKDLNAYIRIALASIMMGLLALLAYQAAGLLFFGEGGFDQALRLGMAILVGIISFIPLLHAFRVDEGKEIWRMACLLIKKAL